MRRRGREGEELLPLELDGEHAPPDGSLVEVGGARPRRPWRDAAVVLAAVALVAAVGLSDGGGEPEAAPEPTTTTTARRRPPRPPRTTTTTEPPGVSVHEPGTGPLLDQPSGSVVVASDGGGRISVLDLDTGDRCHVSLPSRDGGWLQRQVAGRAVVQSDRPVTIGPDCSLEPLPSRRDAEIFPTEDPDRFWLHAWRPGGMQLVLVDPEGVPVGEPVDLALPGGMIRHVAGGLVLDLYGSVTYLDTRTRAVSHLAYGAALATAGERVAIVECVATACDVVVRGVDGAEQGRARGLSPVNVWDGAALSDDGGKVAVLTGDGADQALEVVDLRTGRRRRVAHLAGEGPVHFTADGRHVIVRGGRGPVALPVDGGEAVDLRLGPAGSFVVLPRVAGTAVAFHAAPARTLNAAA